MRYIQLVISDPSLIKLLKTLLESRQLLNKLLKISQRPEDGKHVIPTILVSMDDLELILKENNVANGDLDLEFYEDTLFLDTSNNNDNAHTIIENRVRSLLANYQLTPNELDELIKYIPRKWQIYKPMILFQSKTLETSIFQKFLQKIDNNNNNSEHQSEKFWSQLCEIYGHGQGVTHIAVNAPIIDQDNEMRIPYNLMPIHGDFGPKITKKSLLEPTQEDFDQEFWCSTLQNDVIQTWAPKYTMFSRGNIIEKQRILKLNNIYGNVIVDLYSGIGYFTLHYLVNKPKHCLCWELNPWSNQGLIRALEKRKISFKLITSQNERIYQLDDDIIVYIFQETNENCIERLKDFASSSNLQEGMKISHINLGLLPTSSLIWPKMLQICEFNRPTKGLLPTNITNSIGTTLHIHENCHVAKLDTILDEVLDLLMLLFSEMKERGEVEGKENIYDSFKIEKKGVHKVKTYAPDVWHVVCDLQVYI